MQALAFVAGWLALAPVEGLVPSVPVAAIDPSPTTAEQTRTGATTTPGNEPSPAGEGTALDPGAGLEVWKSDYASLSISPYMVFRYINQRPGTQSFVDHLGRTQEIDTRNDIQAPHRVLLSFFGFVFDPKFRYNTIVWTVNSTDKVAVIGSLGYEFHRTFKLYVGTGGVPGTRSLFGSHPYWLAPDRVLADEFFRPGFSMGAWAEGRLPGRVYYKAMIANNLSQLNINAREDTRDFATAGSLWWMPTTDEFGPRGAYGDFESHEHLATRLGTSFTHSREDRFNANNNTSPENQQIRLADSLNVFDPGALAENVNVQNLDFWLLAIDAGIKYRGLFLQAEFYNRWLTDFVADGPLPVSQIVDRGFYVQGSYMVMARLLELYAATSHIFGDQSAGFTHSWDVLGGANVYPFRARTSRLNAHIIYVDRSPASSLFGYYLGGLKGPIISFSWSVLY